MADENGGQNLSENPDLQVKRVSGEDVTHPQVLQTLPDWLLKSLPEWLVQITYSTIVYLQTKIWSFERSSDD